MIRIGWAVFAAALSSAVLGPGALQRNVDLTRELGFIKASLDVTRFADLSVVEEAAGRLQ
jgi:hypothetical protein